MYYYYDKFQGGENHTSPSSTITPTSNAMLKETEISEKNLYTFSAPQGQAFQKDLLTIKP